jgi:rhamnosyltransferase
MLDYNLSLKKYAIGLILFNPESSLLQRVEVMTSHGFQVYIFDNSPFIFEYSLLTKDKPNIVYLTAGKNVGIGYGLSTLSATACAHGYQSLLFLDQDTGISYRTLEYIENLSKSRPIDIQRQYAALVFSGNTGSSESVQDVRLAISSGSLFNLSVLKQIGWHNEKYFVDCVDYEFCIRARRNGFKIGLVRNTPDFDHVSEQPDRRLTFLGKDILVRSYSAARIKDALGAYIKLIFGGLFINKPADTYVLIKSAVIYMLKQLISRLVFMK